MVCYPFKEPHAEAYKHRGKRFLKDLEDEFQRDEEFEEEASEDREGEPQIGEAKRVHQVVHSIGYTLSYMCTKFGPCTGLR